MSTAQPSSASIARLAKRIPKGTWDTHMHVVDPRVFPLDKAASYQASPHTLNDAYNFLDQLGIEKMVIVQPSIYGNDNSCTLDGLRRLGPENGRAVIQFDPDHTSRTQMREWHNLGVRGVRLNFKSVGGEIEESSLRESMMKYAAAVFGYNWVLELYIALEDVPVLEKVMPTLPGMKICIDHFGHPTAASLDKAMKASDIPGFDALARLLQQGQTWVKISASYRLNKDPKNAVVSDLNRQILCLRPDRCVFATDWPHTRYDGLDVGPYLEAILDGIEATQGASIKQVLVDNAEELFDARSM